MTELRLESMSRVMPRFMMPRRTRVLMAAVGFPSAAPSVSARMAMERMLRSRMMSGDVMTGEMMSAVPAMALRTAPMARSPVAAEAALRTVAVVLHVMAMSLMGEMLRAAAASKMSAAPAWMMAELVRRAAAMTGKGVVRAAVSVRAAAPHRLGVFRTAMAGVAAAPIVPACASLEPHMRRSAPRGAAMCLRLAAGRPVIATRLGRTASLFAAAFRLAMFLVPVFIFVGD